MLDKSYNPLYLVLMWQETGATKKRTNVPWIFPSGVDDGWFKVRVIEETEMLEIVVDWIKQFNRHTLDPQDVVKWWDHQIYWFSSQTLGFRVSSANCTWRCLLGRFVNGSYWITLFGSVSTFFPFKTLRTRTIHLNWCIYISAQSLKTTLWSKNPQNLVCLIDVW